jgi:hypothetical protein
MNLKFFSRSKITILCDERERSLTKKRKIHDRAAAQQANDSTEYAISATFLSSNRF